MLVLVSPAKTLDYESKSSFSDFSLASHLDDTEILVKELKRKNPEELSSLMGLSEKLSNLNFERNMNWTRPKKPSATARQAVFAFKGDVYQGLDVETLSKRDIQYAQRHLCILSGLYGLLKPLDLMYPYRLEMGTKMKNERGDNLYEFWGSKITNSINKICSENKSKVLLNLASVEYFSSIVKKEINVPIVSPVFKDYKNGKYKIISFYAKKARGLMARFVIQNKVKRIEDLYDFNLEGYRFSKKESTDSAPVFLRKN